MMKILATVIFAFTLLAGCGAPSASNSRANSDKISFGLYDVAPGSSIFGSASPAVPERDQQSTDKNIGTAAMTVQEEDDRPPTQPTEPGSRRIIRNGELSLESQSPEETQRKLVAITDASGGFVVETRQSVSNYDVKQQDIVTITLRIPADKFDSVLNEIRSSADRIISETVKGNDVTEQFVDIEARLSAKKALEQQFLEIMKRSNSVAEALEVQRQLAEVRSEIERTEGRRTFLEDQIRLSTLKIEIRTPAAFAGNSTRFIDRLSRALGNGVDFALSFVLGFVSFLIGIIPFILFVLLPVYFVLRHFWRKRVRRKTAQAIVEEELAAKGNE